MKDRNVRKGLMAGGCLNVVSCFEAKKDRIENYCKRKRKSIV